MLPYWRFGANTMSRVSILGLSSLSLVLLGCSIHPLPEDFSGVSTYDIVRQIRCETRESARHELINWLADLGRDHPSQAGVPIARALAERYEQDPNAIEGFGANLFKGPEFVQVRNVVNVFMAIGVAYTFELTMTENNDLSAGSANFQRTFSRSVFKLGIGGSATRSRGNDRNFTVTDTFGNLLTHGNPVLGDGKRYCDGYVVEANYIYPITGRIGVDKLVYDYLNLTIFGGLAGAKDVAAGASGPPAMSDKLTFTTTLDISATPKITFTPVGSAFQLTDAGITADFKRTDMHQVLVGLALPTKAVSYLSGLRSYLFPAGRGVAAVQSAPGAGRGGVIVGARIIGGGTEAEQLAVISNDQLKSREIELKASQ